MSRNRFAPSPPRYLHIGGARTALFSWAFARHHGGQFILRIEDTDIARSTPEAVQAILDGMAWLDLNHDEGPFYQTKRLYRYKEVIEQMLANDQAYLCYCSTEELDAMRESQMARGESLRSGWRPFLYSNLENKKNPALAGSSSFTVRSMLSRSFSFFCAPFIGVLDCEIPVVCLFSGCPPAELFPLPVFLVRPSPPSTRGR